MAPYIVRPLFFILTVILLVSAIGQLGGRILFANLEQLEPRLNELLADQGIAIGGLSGDWRFFNPILKVESLTAPGVDMGAVWAEIDTLESLSRNRVVLRNAAADSVRLALVQDDVGVWSVAGQQPSRTNFDWRSLLWHSDQLDVNAFVSVRAFDRPASELALSVNVSNFGGRHRGKVRVADVDGCDVCGLNAQYNVEEAALWFRERQGGAIVRAENFELHDSLATLAGLSYLKLGELDGRLRLQGERFSGPLSLLNSEMQLPGGEISGLSLLADGWSIDDGSSAAFQIEALQLSNADNVLDVRDVLFNWNSADDSSGGARVLLPQVNVGAVTDVVGNMLAEDIPTARWIRRLGMSGTFTRLVASWSATNGIGFGGDFHDVNIQSAGGVPSVADVEGSFAGGPKYLQLRLLNADARIGFPQLYRDEKDYASVSGQILMYFGQNYFGLEGSNLHLVDNNMVTTGGFSLASTKPLTNNHITLALESNAGKFSDITPYIPYKLPQTLLDWLSNSELSAQLTAPQFVMHGPLREEESNMKRSYLVEAEMQDGELIFNTDWPRIEHANGLVRVSHSSINADLESATLAGLALTDMRIWLPAGAARVTAEGRATFDAGTGLEFIRTTPLRESMDFVADDWWADGKMQLDMQLDVPLDDRAGNELDARVKMSANGKLLGTTFGMPEAGLVFNGLRGGLNYAYPYNIGGENIKGSLFGQPMQMSINSSPVAEAPAGQPARFAPRRIDFSLAGEMHSDNMWPLMSLEPSDVVSGLFDFGAVYSTETDTGVQPSLSVETELLGAQVNLPAPLGKTPEERALTVVSVSFGEADQRANLLYRGLVNVDLGIAEEGINGGHVRLLGSDPGFGLASWDGVPGAIKIDGYLASADVAEWAGGESEVELPPYEITDLTIGAATLGDVAIPDVALTGSSNSERLLLAFDSARATGSLLVPEVEVTELVLTNFNYETDDYSSRLTTAAATDAPMAMDEFVAGVVVDTAPVTEPIIDPIDPEIMDSLQDMRVRIDALTVDGEDYGEWAFQIERVEAGIAFRSLSALVRHVEVESPDGVLWTRASNRTSFDGTLAAEDMGDVLEAWGYARSIESKSMLTNLDLDWSGSPLNCELLQIRGDVAARVRTGRFLDVTSGNNTMRIFSLLNFTAITKRMSLNFKDVFGRGVSFEKVEAITRLDDGLLTLTQPLRVDGTGGDFKVNGRIDLATGELDNEMVVTLPVNKSLPWLGAYLALANPVVGIGVLVGERLLRKPIKELSSAKYRITGNTDDPKLELVSVFDRSMDNTPLDAESVPEAEVETVAESEEHTKEQTKEQTDTNTENAAETESEGIEGIEDIVEAELEPATIIDSSPAAESEPEAQDVPEPIGEDPGAESFQATDSPGRVSQARLTMYP